MHHASHDSGPLTSKTDYNRRIPTNDEIADMAIYDLKTNADLSQRHGHIEPIRRLMYTQRCECIVLSNLCDFANVSSAHTFEYARCITE